MLYVLLMTLAAGDCGSCHEDAERAWAASRHARAQTNETYAVSFASAQHEWCETCHAPQGARGVGCVSCHTAHDRPAADVCANCHQFDYPVRRTLSAERVEYTDLPMQNTVEEWRSSSYASTACAECHGAHDVRGARDVAWLRSVLSMDAVFADDVWRITVTAEGAGHAVPTGDPFRVLRVAIHMPYEGQTPVIESAALERVAKQDGDRWILVDDTRIPPPSDGRTRSSVTVELSAEALPKDAFVRLTYEYADPMHRRRIREDDVVVTIAELEPTP